MLQKVQKQHLLNRNCNQENFMEILVFKTNVTDRKIKRKLFPLLRSVEGILKWNIDFDDEDKVLRVESLHISPRDIENKLRSAGIFCSELPD